MKNSFASSVCIFSTAIILLFASNLQARSLEEQAIFDAANQQELQNEVNAREEYINRLQSAYPSLPQEPKDVLGSVLWILLPALLIWFAYYFIAGREDVSSIKIFYLIIFLAVILPLAAFNIKKSNIISQANKSRYSKSPIHTMKAYPLNYGMTTSEVMERWGPPTAVQYNGAIENWLYSRNEPIGSFRLGISYAFFFQSGWEECFVVNLSFRDGLLFLSDPDLELVRKAEIHRIAR